MAALKLTKLPDRTPVKVTITMAPDLHRALQDYEALYAGTYGVREPLAELIPAMLSAFLDADREFAKRRRSASIEE